MSAIEMFNYAGQEVRIIPDATGKAWFVAADVCTVLGIANSRDALARLDDDEKGVGTTDTPGGPQRVATVSEEGVYGPTWTSRKKQAAHFRRWVKHDVLPSIFRTGSYSIPQQRPPALPQTYAEALRELAATVEAKELAEARVTELEPLAKLAADLIGSGGDISVAEAAKALHRAGIATGRNRLMTYLREIRWVDRKGEPYQREVEAGRLGVKVGVYEAEDSGEIRLSNTPRITGKGLSELRSRLMEQQQGELVSR